VKPLGREFFARPSLEVARDLLGTVLDHDGVAVRISEVEAYDGANDSASHAFRGQTPRNAVMFGPAGYSYVYFTYGMHFCMNLVCGEVGVASAVLIRAGEVIRGRDAATARRGDVAVRDLARGPARLCKALAIDRAENGLDVTDRSGILRVFPGRPVPDDAVRRGPRVGVSTATDWPYRLWIDGDPTVSQYRAHTPRTRRT
jgi:DNA-3-methyladenine glycosylase